MDKTKIVEIARCHQEALARPSAESVPILPDELYKRDIAILWTRLGEQCREFCDTYNSLMADPHHLYCDVHNDTIVIRSGRDLQETLTFSRTPPGSRHRGTIGCHRYSAHAHDERLPVGWVVANGVLRLSYGSQDGSVEDIVLILLKRFSDELIHQND